MAAEAAGRMDGSASTIDEILKYAGPNDFCFRPFMVLDDSYGGDGMVATNDIKSWPTSRARRWR